jgi:hypothetical protein
MEKIGKYQMFSSLYCTEKTLCGNNNGYRSQDDPAKKEQQDPIGCCQLNVGT